jgi:hypothetical protein
VSGHGHRRRGRQVQALPGQRADGGHLGQRDAGAGDCHGGQLVLAGGRLSGGQGAHPLHRLEADRTDHDELAGNRFQQQFGLADDCAQFRFDSGHVDQFLEILQPGAALTAEDHRVRFTRAQQIDQGLG